MITLRTTQGDISIELDFDKAPNTAANYLQYARDGFYNGTIFHRVIPGFMVQGGGMDAEMNEKESRESIENEADNGLTNEISTLAMARTSDPHSASSQFFINVSNNGFLNHSGKNSQGVTLGLLFGVPSSISIEGQAVTPLDEVDPRLREDDESFPVG